MSSPTRFSAKKRNARHMVKAAHVPEPSSEAREVAPVEAPQAPVEKADTTASPVASLQTASEQLSSAFASFAQRKPAEVSAAQPAEKSAAQPAEKSAAQPAEKSATQAAEKPVENMRSKVAPEKKKRQRTPLSARKSIRVEKRPRNQADPEPEQRHSRPVSAGRRRLELVSVVAILVLAVLSIVLVNRPSQKTLVFGDNQVTYTGTTIQGKMNGQGKMTFENGDTYEGEFVDGYFQGTGTYTSKDGWTYEGQFVKGQADGQGRLTTQDNIVYEGTFKQGIYQSAN